MVPGQTRTVKLDIRNVSTVDLAVTDETKATGSLFGDGTGTKVTLSDYDTPLVAGHEETVTLTVVAGDWDDSLQNQGTTEP